MTHELDKENMMKWLESVASGEVKPSQILGNFTDVFERLNHEVMQRREQIMDINEWSGIILKHSDYSGITLRPRVLRSFILDINNRTTD